MPGSAYAEVKSGISSSIRNALSSLGYPDTNLDSSIDFSKAIGDISCSISFRISKEKGKDPNAIAQEIKSIMRRPERVESVSVEKGFINFHLNRNAFSLMVLEQERLPLEGGGKAIVEYPSVNPNKPWHVGHLRNALLGDSLSKIFAALGMSVVRQDYIDDLGLQMAETMWWHLNRNESKPDKKFDHWLGEEYVKVSAQIEEPGVKEAVKATLSLMEQDGTYESVMLRTIAGECVRAQYDTAFDYGIYHNVLVWESDIVRERIFEKAIERLKRSNFIETPTEGDYANCTIINLKAIKDLPDDLKGLKEDAKVLIRSNGTPTYLGKDIAFHMWKLGILENDFKFSVFMEQQRGNGVLYTTSPEGSTMRFGRPTAVINLIDVRQSHPQAVLRAVFKAMGEPNASAIYHLAYGIVELESGVLSGRKGTWMGYSADDLLRETKAKARKLITERFKLDDKEQERIASAVALAAIKFEFLKFSNERKIVFSWEKALNFEGNSGPHMQYMHARASRILEEAQKGHVPKWEGSDIADHEFELVKQISRAEQVVEKSAREMKPNVIAEYVTSLASAFSEFYDKSPVLKAEKEQERVFRIMLTSAFKNVMGMMLNLLGIEALERM